MTKMLIRQQRNSFQNEKQKPENKRLMTLDNPYRTTTVRRTQHRVERKVVYERSNCRSDTERHFLIEVENRTTHERYTYCTTGEVRRSHQLKKRKTTYAVRNHNKAGTIAEIHARSVL